MSNFILPWDLPAPSWISERFEFGTTLHNPRYGYVVLVGLMCYRVLLTSIFLYLRLRVTFLCTITMSRGMIDIVDRVAFFRARKALFSVDVR